VTAGLIMASAALLIGSTTAAAVMVAAAGLFTFTKLHPMLILGTAAIAGAIGPAG
jgi:hypothetical protein